MAYSRSNREVKKWIFLKFTENVLQLIPDTPEFFQIFLTHISIDNYSLKVLYKLTNSF